MVLWHAIILTLPHSLVHVVSPSKHISSCSVTCVYTINGQNGLNE